MEHYKDSLKVSARAEEVFAYIDDHTRFSSHMSRSSWMMGGGNMTTLLDEGRGKTVGSHIRMKGKVFGFNLYLDEIVTLRQPPHSKVWKTVGDLRLLVMGHYQMQIDIIPQDNASWISVSIDYELPEKNAWLGKLFGGWYAKWCVHQMLLDVKHHFSF